MKPVYHPVLDGLGEMDRVDVVLAGQIGDRARDLEDPVIGPGAETELCHGNLREISPDFMRTWGDYIKVRRLDLKLTKRQLSLKLNVSDITIYLWEKNRVKPSLPQIPKIIEFLGRDPF